jgi:hypothetical protein
LIQTVLCLKLSLLNVPNAKYEEVKFKFEKSIVAGEMNGKTYMIKGTINGKAFISGVVKMLNWKFEDSAKDFTVNGNDISLNIKIHLML